MVLFGMILLSIGAISMIISAVFFVLYRIFEYKPQMLGKCLASLQSVKHKKDVPVYGKNSTRGPRHIVMIIKNWSRGVYEYTVNDRKYKIHYVDFVTPRNMLSSVPVIYLKKIPKIAYVKTDTNSHNFEIYSLVALLFSILWAVGGFSAIFH